MLKFLDTNYRSPSIQPDLLILAPFLLKNSSDKTSATFELAKHTFSRISASIANRSQLNPSALEKDSLLLSLGTWSLLMHKQPAGFFGQSSPVALRSLVRLLNEFELLRVGVIADKSVDLFDVERCFAHVLRAVHLSFIASLNVSKADKKLRSETLELVGTIFGLLKNQLSSPYHEVK